MTIVDHYKRFLADTGSEVAAAIFALDAAQKEQAPAATGRDTLTPRDVAKQLAVSPATVIEWIRSGQLKAANIATGPRPRFVIKPEDLATFLDNRQPVPPAQRRRNKPQTTSKRF